MPPRHAPQPEQALDDMVGGQQDSAQPPQQRGGTGRKRLDFEEPDMSLRPARASTCALTLTLSVALVSASACSSSAGSKSASAAVLKVATTADVTTWDPVKSFSTEVFYLANVYEPLLWKNPAGSAEPYRPALAT